MNGPWPPARRVRRRLQQVVELTTSHAVAKAVPLVLAVDLHARLALKADKNPDGAGWPDDGNLEHAAPVPGRLPREITECKAELRAELLRRGFAFRHSTSRGRSPSW